MVAPISVNGGRSSVSVRAAGPWPTMMSSRKSSSAGYRISSAARFSRWISSTNSTSRGSSVVRIAAMSPFRSSAGPATWRMPTPSSLRTICASDVLPSPGGPASRRWSSASPRAFAAARAIDSCSLTRSWPTKSSSERGRSDRSSSSSASASTGARNWVTRPPGAPGAPARPRAGRAPARRARARRRPAPSRARRARRGR